MGKKAAAAFLAAALLALALSGCHVPEDEIAPPPESREPRPVIMV